MRKRYIYLGIAVLILLWTMLSSKKDCYYRKFDYKDLNRYYNNDLAADENSGYSGTLVSTPEISLPAGQYAVSVNYETDTDQNMLFITSGREDFDGTEQRLSPDTDRQETVLRLDQAEREILVHVDYGGTGRLAVENIEFRSDVPVCTDRFAIGFTALLLLAIWIWLDLKNSPARKIYLWILAMAVMASLPYFNQSITHGHDTRFNLARIEEVCAGLKDGQFPVYIQPDAIKGYGYAAPLLYPQLFLYIPGLLRAADVSMVTAVGIFFLLLNLATAGIMYFCAYRMFSSRFTALASSMFYMFALYRLVNQCTRFAIGEELAMVFLPLVIYGLYEVLDHDRTKWPWLTVGCCGVLQSHVISTMFAVMLIVIFCLIFIRRLFQKQRFFALLKAGIWTVLLNLWFIVPFLDMYQKELHTGNLQIDINTMTVSFVHLFEMFPFADEGLNDRMPVCLGIALILFSAFCLYGLAVGEYKRDRKMPAICLCLGILFTVVTTQWFPWEVLYRVPLLKGGVAFIQFPWRFLACSTVFLSFSAGAGACWLRDKYNSTLSVMAMMMILSLLPLGYYIGDLVNRDILLMKEEVAECDVTTGNEYMYENVDLGTIYARPQVPLSTNKDFVAEEYEKHGTHINVEYNLQGTAPAAVELTCLYYPGFEVLYRNMADGADGKVSELESYSGNNCYLSVMVPPGTGQLTVRFKGAFLWRLSFVVSLAALAGFAVNLWMEQRNISILNGLTFFRNRRHMHGSQ